MEPSLKNVSTAEIEAAIAQALATLTGWETCTVRIDTVDFVGSPYSGGEAVDIKLRARFDLKKIENDPL